MGGADWTCTWDPTKSQWACTKSTFPPNPNNNTPPPGGNGWQCVADNEFNKLICTPKTSKDGGLPKVDHGGAKPDQLVTKADQGVPAPTCTLSTKVPFAESGILTGAGPAIAGPKDVIKAYYVDEHALTLGQSGAGQTVSPCKASPDIKLFPNIGDAAAKDGAGRPLWPAVYITDITTNPSDTSGDWQSGGTPIPPTAVYGTWKAANGPDPSLANVYNVGNGDKVPQLKPGDHDYGKTLFSAEVQWSGLALGLQSGHNYRVQIILHDGDQNGQGGDAGQYCVTIKSQ